MVKLTDGACGGTKQKPELFAGDEELLRFCNERYLISDPVIVVWVTEYKPNFSIENSRHYSNLDNDTIRAFTKEQLTSLFFPMGFINNDWNFVLLGSKKRYDVIGQGMPEHLIRGWLMGRDILYNSNDITSLR